MSSSDASVKPGFAGWFAFDGRLTLKLVAIGLLLLVLQLPAAMIRASVAERAERQQQAEIDIGRQWGGAQHLAGPILALPIRRAIDQSRTVINPVTGARETLTTTGWGSEDTVYLLPKSVTADGTIAGEERRRGLFSAAVFTAAVRAEGEFDLAGLAGRLGPGVEIGWDKALLLGGLGDMGGVQPGGAIEWNGAALTPAADSDPNRPALFEQSVWARLPRLDPAAGPQRFALDLRLRGSGRLDLAPLAETGLVRLASDWPAPGFTDAPDWAPTDDGGFRAQWRTSALNRAAPASFTGADRARVASALQGGLAGVALEQTVTTYARVLRAANYAVLFLILTFLAYLLAEGFGGVRIHIVQYGLVGLSLSLFVLMLLALAEQMGFGLAYAASALLIVGQTGVYTGAVTGSRRLAAKITGLIAALYGFLYVTLNIENQALLAGTLALYVGLSAIMVATRRLDRWGKGRAEAAG